MKKSIKTSLLLIGNLFTFLAFGTAPTVYEDLGPLNSGITLVKNGTTTNSANYYPGNGNGGLDYTYKFTASGAFSIDLTTCGTTWDTYLYLLDANGNVVAYNDDLSSCSSNTLASGTNYSLTSGTYYIVVDAYSSSYSGAFVLNITTSGGITLPAISVNSPSVNENAGSASFTISLSQTSATAVTGYYSTSNGTALSGSDYTAKSSTSFTISAGSTSLIVPVTIIDDAVSESTETFSFNVTSVSNASNTSASGNCSITDNDTTLPALSVSSPNVNENAGPVSFTISLNQTSATAVTGYYATSNGTALAGSDYTAKSSTSFTIPAGSTSINVSVTILDDAVSESTETFNLILSNPTNATIATGTGVGTIFDNDATGSVTSVNNMTGAVILGLSGSSSGTNRTIGITNGTSATIDVADNDNSATNELQSLSVSGNILSITGGNSVTLPAGTSSQWTTSTSGNDALFSLSGNVGIGTATPLSKLSVNGTIRATEVLVKTNINVPDYVFAPGYKILPLKELEEFLKQNSHLPGIPSAKEMEEKGIGLSEMNLLLLKKIEELTLYIIEQNKRIEKLESKQKIEF